MQEAVSLLVQALLRVLGQLQELVLPPLAQLPAQLPVGAPQEPSGAGLELVPARLSKLRNQRLKHLHVYIAIAS